MKSHTVNPYLYKAVSSEGSLGALVSQNWPLGFSDFTDFNFSQFPKRASLSKNEWVDVFGFCAVTNETKSWKDPILSWA